jgi:hypothetical protein
MPGAVMLARLLVNTQAGKTDYPQALALLQKAAENWRRASGP